MSFDWLKNLKFKEERPVKPVASKNPEGLTLRVFLTSGRVFPSQELVDRFKLEYGVEGECGIDFFTAHNWGIYPKSQPNALFLTFVPRTEPKIDLFATRRSEETKVIDQAPVSRDLVEAIKQVYPSAVTNDTPFLDLTIREEDGITTEDGLYFIPKSVARGEKKGQLVAQRRENIVLYPASVQVITDTEVVVQDDLIHQLNAPTV
jgi:hypothetical protein